jgi:putative hydrolase of the HAD superfamily
MIAWENIETVLLDMDGTLLDLYFDNYFWQEYLPDKWGEINGLDPGTARNTLMPRFTSRVGTLSWYCIDFWSDELQLDIMALKSEIDHLINYRPHAREFLAGLGRTGKQLVLVTNAHRKLLELKIQRTGIDRYFSNIFCAHDFGAPKEELDFWLQLGAAISFNPASTLLIDDNIAVLRKAREYGIGYLLTIAQPDSRSAARDTGEFQVITSFRELLRQAVPAGGTGSGSAQD